MQTTIKLEFEIEEKWADVYQKALRDRHNQIIEELKTWFEQYIQSISEDIDKDDPWLAFREDYAVDTGIEDFSINHDHYLFGLPRQT